MEIEFNLTERDVLALALRKWKRSPALQRGLKIRRYAYLVGFGLMGVCFALAAGTDSPLYILSRVFFAMGIALFLVYPFVYPLIVKARLEKSVETAFKDEKKRETYGTRIMRSTKDCLDEISSFGEVKINWKTIDEIETAPEGAYIVINQLPALIIPKEQVGKTFDEFVQACRKFKEESGA